MSLYLATLLPGVLLVLAGALLLWNDPRVEVLLRAFPRSRRAAAVLFGAASIWLLVRVANLGEADFGNYRAILVPVFALLALGAFRYAPDFLAVRGACALHLLAAKNLLDAAFLQEPPQRLILVTTVYAGIFLAMWLAVSPWRARDFIAWLQRSPVRVRALGGLLAAHGAVLAITAHTY